MATRQKQQVENLAAIMRTFDGPGKVILVNHSVLTYDAGLQTSPYKFPQEWYGKIRGSVSLRAHRIRLCNLGITHPQNGRPPISPAFLLTNLQFPDGMNHCRCGQPHEQHVPMPPTTSRARYDIMMNFNSLLIILMKWQIPKVKLNLRYAQAIMEQHRLKMPNDVQAFYEVRLRRIFTEAGADLQFHCDEKSDRDELEPSAPQELYPTESRVNQKEREGIQGED